MGMFEIRTYSYTELAQLYRPDVQSQSARRTLKRWIRRDPELQKALQRVGYDERARDLTPRQVSVLVEFLGEP